MIFFFGAISLGALPIILLYGNELSSGKKRLRKRLEEGLARRNRTKFYFHLRYYF